MTNKNTVISRLIISQTTTDNTQKKETIECYRYLIEQLSNENFTLAMKYPIKRNPMAMAEAIDDENAWECFRSADEEITQTLLNAWN